MKVPKILRLTGLSPDDYLAELKRQVDSVLESNAAEKKACVPCEWKFINKYHGIEILDAQQSEEGLKLEGQKTQLRSSFVDAAKALLSKGVESTSFDDVLSHAMTLSQSWQELHEDIGNSLWPCVILALEEMGTEVRESPLLSAFLACVANELKCEILANLSPPVLWFPHPSEVPVHLWRRQLDGLMRCYEHSGRRTVLRLLLRPWSLCAHRILLGSAGEGRGKQLTPLCRLVMLDAGDDVSDSPILTVFVPEIRRAVATESPTSLETSLNILPEWLLGAPFSGALARLWHRLLLLRAVSGSASDWVALLEALLPDCDQRAAAMRWTQASLCWAGTDFSCDLMDV